MSTTSRFVPKAPAGERRHGGLTVDLVLAGQWCHVGLPGLQRRVTPAGTEAAPARSRQLIMEHDDTRWIDERFDATGLTLTWADRKVPGFDYCSDDLIGPDPDIGTDFDASIESAT